MACASWLVVGLAAQGANAQPDAPSEQPDNAYRELLQKGASHYDDGDYEKAVEAWERALEAAGEEKGWKIHYNLGLAREALNDPTRAAAHYSEFLKRVAAETASLAPALEQRREDSAARLKVIQQTHGAVVLRPQPERVTVTIDGGKTREVGFVAYLPAGEHVIVLTGPTGERREERVTVANGQQQVVDTRPPKPAPAPVPNTAEPKPPPPDTAEEPEFPLTIVLIGVGVTAVSFALPGAMWNIAANHFDDAEALGRGHTGYDAAVDDYNDAREAYFASYALPAALGAITAGIAIWGAVHVSGGPDEVGLSVGPGTIAIDARF